MRKRIDNWAGGLVLGLAITAVGTSAVAQQSLQPCAALADVNENTRLSQVSDFWFGDSTFRYAIMLATNTRTGQDGIKYIDNIYDLPANGKICVPESGEAFRLKQRYSRYIDAVRDMAVAEPFEVVDSLTPLPSTGSFTVATWIREGERSRFPKEPGPMVVTGDTWVTLEPGLQDFCKAFVRNVSDNPEALVLRVEQRLGLGPASSKTLFARFRIDTASDGPKTFRPCGDPATGSTSCEVGIPAVCNADCEAHTGFFYQQYYNAFGTAHPIQLPWTSLGYTFDWGPGALRLDGTIGFVRVGESEYVVPDGATAEFLGAVPTVEYCEN